MKLKILASLLSAVIITAFFSSCSSSKGSVDGKDSSQSEPKPSWVKQRPVDQYYYIGISVVEKDRYPNRYADEARKLALTDLASEIEVDIKSSSMLFSAEDASGEFRDEYRSYSRVNTNKSLSNYEMEGVYETDKKYYVYYRLSKEQYERDRNERMNRSVDQSKKHVQTAEDHIEQRRYRDAFVAYMKAMQSIEPFAGEPLKTTFNDKETYWGNHLLNEINRFADGLRLNSGAGNHTVVWGLEPDEEAVSFLLRDKENRAISGVPVQFEYSEGFVRPRVALTDVEGRAKANLTKIRKKKEHQKLKASVDLVEMFNSAGSDNADAFMEGIIKKVTAPRSEKQYTVRPPSVFVNYAAELPSGMKASEDIPSAAKDRLNTLGFSSAPNPAESDIMITINVTVKMMETMSDMHRCSLTGEMDVVLTDSKEDLFSESFPSIKGVQLSDPAAVQNAVYKAADEMDAVLIPRFHRYLLK